ncbi:MAG: PA1571 family protein [Gammaproteobacteria bacterium]
MNNIDASLNPAQRERAVDAPRTAPIGWGAAIVDENGNETPITESMIERACAELAGSWLFPRRQYAAAR